MRKALSALAAASALVVLPAAPALADCVPDVLNCDDVIKGPRGSSTGTTLEPAPTTVPPSATRTPDTGGPLSTAPVEDVLEEAPVQVEGEELPFTGSGSTLLLLVVAAGLMTLGVGVLFVLHREPKH
jgi:hypothetical protein